MSAVIECPDCPDGDVEVDADQGHCLTCGWWESYEEQVERRAAVVSAESVEALAGDDSAQSRLRHIIECAIARSPEVPNGFLGEDITLAILASDWLAQHDREVAARAWDEGMGHESDHLMTFGQFCPGKPGASCAEAHNPYRADRLTSSSTGSQGVCDVPGLDDAHAIQEGRDE